jgi:exodeoxyribonuclease VII large subunit
MEPEETAACYTVTEITRAIRGLLEQQFYNITVEGEISNFRPSSTGHYYFSLKDENALLSVVMFKNRLGRLAFQPADGQRVKAGGNISVYARRGNYQLICESLVRSGEGELLARLEERKKRLAARGLFAPERKKPLPLFPARVAVVTSPTGAALRDILHVLQRRNAGINLVVLPAPVQGEGAAAIIAGRIRTANDFDMADVLIVGRGGGSLEDLLPFYEEEVVQAIADSGIPVISAVGHEIDFTFSDLAADLRAPTPSAAAELVSASRVELTRRVGEIKASMIEQTLQRLERIRLLASQFTAENLERNFKILVQPCFLRLDDARDTLLAGMSALVLQRRHALELVAGSIQSYSPLSILRRGYALVTHEPSGRLVTSSEQVRIPDPLHIRFAAGAVRADVKEIVNEEL